MTTIIISEIRITSTQIIAKINDNDTYLESFDLSQILKHITEKTIVIKSRKYHKHNDYQSFKNNFMLKIYNLLDNANFNQIPEKYTYKENKTDYCEKQNYRFVYPHWLIDKIDYSDDMIMVTIRNIKNERLEDN